MDNLIRTESRGGAAPLQSAGCRAPRRSDGWLRMAAVALGLTALAAPAAQAGVEFVTRTGDCTKVDVIGDGKDLFIIAGPDVRFRVFGDFVDVDNPATKFRIATDSGAGAVTARIVSKGNNSDCAVLKGWALVEVDSPVDLTSDIQRSLFFKMPAGDESRLQMKIKAYPAIDAVWTSVQSNIGCIIKTGSFEKLDQDHKIRIQLPPGHRQDQTTCNSRTLSAQVHPSDIGELDIAKDFKYSVVGLPAFLQSSQATALGAQGHPVISFTISVSGIRALTAVSNSNIVIRSLNPNRSRTLNLEVQPSPLANGFTQAANCRNPVTGDSVNINDLVQCELRLAAPPPAAGQLITFEVQDRLCVAAGAPNVNYASASGIGTTTLTGAATIFQVPLRVLGGNTSAGTPCASGTPGTGTQHLVKFWIGARDIESGADFTQDTFLIRSLP